VSAAARFRSIRVFTVSLEKLVQRGSEACQRFPSPHAPFHLVAARRVRGRLQRGTPLVILVGSFGAERGTALVTRLHLQERFASSRY
jgi:hypothetical protein